MCLKPLCYRESGIKNAQHSLASNRSSKGTEYVHASKKGKVRYLHVDDINNCWFARDVTVVCWWSRTKSISLLWELNSIFT